MLNGLGSVLQISGKVFVDVAQLRGIQQVQEALDQRAIKGGAAANWTGFAASSFSEDYCRSSAYLKLCYLPQ